MLIRGTLAVDSRTRRAEGWGAEMGYPRPDPNGEGTISGWIFESPHLEGARDRLNEFESTEYPRIRVTARTDNSLVDAWVYALP